MAFVAQDDKQNLNNGQAPGSQVVGSGTGTFAGNAGGASTSTQPSTAGVGAGGSNGWTNIQSYLTANQGSTGSADALNKTAGGAFNQEQSNLDQSSKQATDKANQEVQKTNIGQDQASQMISEMGNNYNYGGNQNQTYNQDLSRFQTGLNSTYGGPTSYSYGMGADAQRYGQALGSDQGFQGLMSGLYNQAAGGVMNQGQLSLQQNLDTNNDALNSARQNLQGQYSGLQNNIQNTTQSTDAAVRAAQQQYGQNQQAIRDYLTGTRNTDQSQMQQAIDSWNQAEQAIASGQNKVYFGNDPRGTEVRNYNKSAADNRGDQMGFNASRSLNDDDYYNYASGGTADMTNVGGEDTQRGQLNALADILGGAKINQGQALSHGGYNFDQNRYNQAWDAAQNSAYGDINAQIQHWLGVQNAMGAQQAITSTFAPKPSGTNPYAPTGGI